MALQLFIRVLEKLLFVSCRSMEDGQIGTVKFVDHNEEERFTVQLYVICRNSVLQSVILF